MTDWYVHPCKEYTGGGDASIDAIDGSIIKENDAVLLIKSSTGRASVHYVDEDSGESESSPDIISPDANAGNKRWKRAQVLTNAAVVDFLQAGTGAVARSAQARLRDCISVKDFGAVGDGSTDDTNAIQAAITAAVAAGGLRVVLPQTSSGNYLITSKLTVTGKVFIEGDGQYHTRIVCDACDGIEISQGVSGVKISNLEISHAVRYTTTTNTHTAITALGVTGSRPYNLILSDVYIDGFEYGVEGRWLWNSEFRNVHINYGLIAIYLSGLGCNNTISDCKICTGGAAGSRGLLLGDGTNASEGIMVQNSLIYGSEANIEAVAWGQSCITNCIIDFGIEYGIQLRNSATNMCSGWNISNNYIAIDGASGTAGISLYNDITHAQNLGNRVCGNYLFVYDTKVCQYGIVINGTDADNNTIIGNVLKGFSDIDIYVVSGDNNIISGNQCLTASPSVNNIFCTTLSIAYGNYVADSAAYSGGTHQGATAFMANAASPVGSVVPKFIGEEYLDTNANKWYKSSGLTNTDWIALN